MTPDDARLHGLHAHHALHSPGWLPRRALLAAAGMATLLPPARASDAVRDLLRRGGVVIALRHALAPGTFDPEGFRLEDCSTQRNLNDEGRDQARRIGAWFQAQALQPARVRTSPWCRCVDTAHLAFGRSEPWMALASPTRGDSRERGQRVEELQRTLAAVPAGRFEAWVTHQFVLQDLAASSVSSAEALVLQATAGSGVAVLARATLY
jgi:phosphohistidine phosphatase SixA